MGCDYDPSYVVNNKYYSPVDFKNGVYFFQYGYFLENLSSFLEKQDSMEVKAITEVYSELKRQDGYLVVIGKK